MLFAQSSQVDLIVAAAIAYFDDVMHKEDGLTTDHAIRMMGNVICTGFLPVLPISHLLTSRARWLTTSLICGQSKGVMLAATMKDSRKGTS